MAEKMNTDQFKKYVLQYAIQGKLVEQDKNEEPASELLKKIRAEKQKLIKDKKIKADKNESFIYRKNDSFFEKIGKEEKCIDDEIPFDIPENWEWCRQKSVCWLYNGETIKGVRLPYLEVRFLRRNKEPIFKEKGVKVCPGEKLILVDGENSGEIFISPTLGYMGSTFKLLSTVSNINEKYILIFFELNKNLYKNTKTGSAIPHLNKKIFADILIPLPPLEEQKRIMEKVDKILSLLEEYSKKENQLKELSGQLLNSIKNGVLQKAIEGKLVKQDNTEEPASELLKKIRAEKQKLIKDKKIKADKNESFIYRKNGSFFEKIGKEEKCIDDEIPFDIPENWEWCRQKSVCWLYNGETIKGVRLPYLEVRFLRRNKEPIFKEKGVKVCPGEKLILVDGENSGEIFISPTLGYMGSTFKLLSTVSNINEKYILIFFELNKNLYKNTKTGSAIPHLNKKIFADILIPLPPLEEQKRIVEKIEQIFPLIEKVSNILK
ncbi:restriction endonuclease subunit S [Mycoplasma phocoenae]|uniref:Type I restriction modification DNA specificity domain-containing protein n=1 Tax=Mycoplasma phocoenae TaxID=754517 RepID=A0A858U145_9MOLU|nr:restriction endonuclease subunit S [Mycoplasma phocoenae]QJG66824.1 hypothetical protein HGG69_00550 [Mycoplasma phocoenae]